MAHCNAADASCLAVGRQQVEAEVTELQRLLGDLKGAAAEQEQQAAQSTALQKEVCRVPCRGVDVPVSYRLSSEALGAAQVEQLQKVIQGSTRSEKQLQQQVP